MYNEDNSWLTVLQNESNTNFKDENHFSEIAPRSHFVLFSHAQREHCFLFLIFESNNDFGMDATKNDLHHNRYI